MVKITYIEDSGERHTIDAPLGLSMMKAAVNEGIEGIVAECGGNCACGTCRVYVPEEWRDKLQPPQDTETEMIQYSEDENPGVRLSCQIPVTEELDGIEVRMPKSQY
ncbi:MAG: 2Fe-2S iron-sulfur cluster-binding protein [Novosphingobium sp.]